MNISRGLTALLLILAAGAGKASGADWASPDGAIVVATPDPAKFRFVDNPPEPFLALWISNDETLRLGVMKATMPANVKTLIRSSGEQGLAEEIHGTITGSSTMVKNGHEIWLMAAKGSIQGINAQVSQALVQCNGSVYKVMAATIGNGPSDDPTINAFVNSIQVKLPNSNPPAAQPVNSEPNPGGGTDPHNLSKRFGGIGALVLIGLLVWRVVRKK